MNVKTNNENSCQSPSGIPFADSTDDPSRTSYICFRIIWNKPLKEPSRTYDATRFSTFDQTKINHKPISQQVQRYIIISIM